MSRPVEFLVEEPSVTPYIDAVILATAVELEYSVREFNGKQDLLRKLPARLKAYAAYARRPQIVVLVDRDDQDCRSLKSSLEVMAANAGLLTATTAAFGTAFQVCNRIVVAELESWALGDEKAVLESFPHLRPFAAKSRFRDPDLLEKPSRDLERLLQRAGYYPAGLSKVDCAQRVASRLDLTANRSRSFAAFAGIVPSLGSD